ncbi:MAG: hypothetical protein JWR21_4348 [Herminiimonas sp.]|nr:hypothetical protein [Herminiimonas sp.]
MTTFVIPGSLQSNHALLGAIQHRLRQFVTLIVDRHRTAGEVLTWRRMHAIEDEAFESLEATGAFDDNYLAMLHSSCVRVPELSNDMIVNVLDRSVLPLAFRLIVDAYKISH